MGELLSHLGLTITPAGAAAVVIASCVLYVLYAVVLTLWGPRLAASSSTFSLALLTVLGSLTARAMLGDAPTMAGAVIAAITLLTLEGLLGRMRAGSVERRRRARVAMVDGVFLIPPRPGRSIGEADLMAQLRARGIQHVADVAIAIIEPRGGLTIVRRGQTIDARLLAGVRDVDRIPDGHISRPGE